MQKLLKKLPGSWGGRREERQVSVLDDWLEPELLWLQLSWKLPR